MSSERWAALASLLAVATLALAVPAMAQDEEAEPPGDSEPPEAEDGEEVLVDPRFEEARSRFLAGVELAEAGNCPGAIAEFDASFALVERPNTLYNIARCHQTLHRYDLALEAYRRYLAMAPPDAPDRAAVEARLESLGDLLGTIAVQSNVEADVWLGDRVVGRAPGEVLVPGGQHLLELRAEGYLPERTQVEVTARSRVEVALELGRAETVQVVQQHNTTTAVTYEAPPLPAALTVSMMVATAGALGVGVGFGVHALLLSDAEQARDPRLERDAAGVDEAALFADVFFITAGVLGAATVAMAFLTDWGERPAAAEGEVRVVPLLGPLYAGLRVEGLP